MSETFGFGRTVSWMVKQLADRRPHHPALVWEPFDSAVGRRVWTYRQLATEVERLASGLRARGIRENDRVLLHMENCPEFVLAWLACARIGAVAVCTNTKSTESELVYFADHTEARAVVTQASFATIVGRAARSASWMAVVDERGDGSWDLPFDDLYGDGEIAGASPDQFSPVSIQFTSGTTARPKAVVWTHANVLFGAKVSASHQGMVPRDITLTYLPLFHTNALMYSLLATLWVGGTVVLQPRFSATRFWETSLRHQCTWASVVPFVVHALGERGGDVPSHHYRMWGNGISGWPEEHAFGVRTLGWYGMTETVTHCIVDEPEIPGRAGAMGRACPEFGVRLVDDEGASVGPNQVGNIHVRGDAGTSLFAGYLHDEEATRASYTDDGWFVTGDQAELQPDGYLSFAGRTKDMLKVSGENVAALEVEAAIMAVAGVREVAVVGRPDRMRSELPVAFVMASEPSERLADQIVSHCRSVLSDYKVPVEIRFVDDLPRSTLHKVAKGSLRALFDDTIV